MRVKLVVEGKKARRRHEGLAQRLDHLHSLIHGLTRAVADLARCQCGGMTREDVAQVVARLNSHATKLEGIIDPDAPRW